jgi:hypothetical protein
VSEERLKDIESRVARIETMQAVADALGKTIESRLGKIEDTLTWLVRLIIGAMIMAILAFMISGGFIPAGG